MPLLPKLPPLAPQHQRQLLALRYWLLGRQWHQASEALDLAMRRHTGLRKDGETPEVVHQIAIASHLRTLPSLRHPERTLVVGLLHDTVEDTGLEVSAIAQQFGSDVAADVWALSKVGPAGKRNEEEVWAGIASNPVASICKGVDRIHNIGSMAGVFTLEKQQAYLDEVHQWVLPVLKAARRTFPDQEPAYEAILTTLRHQVSLFYSLVPTLRISLDAEG